MKKALIILAMLATAAGAAELRPVRNTFHAPYRASKSYCNVNGKVGAENVNCYNHDACYSDPTFKGTRKPPATRQWCDGEFCAHSDAFSCAMVKAFGGPSWRRARSNDSRQ